MEANEDYEVRIRALRGLMSIDDSVVFRYDGNALWLRNVHVGGDNWALGYCGYGHSFAEALDDYYNKLTDLADQEWVIINAFEHAGPRIMLKYSRVSEQWKRKEIA